MNSYSGNGHSFELAMFETPFADTQASKETYTARESLETVRDNFLQDFESPFSRTYETGTAARGHSQVSEEFVQFLGELNDTEFSNTLYEMASEIEDTWLPKISNEAAMGDKYLPFATQQASEYIRPLLHETESMIDRVAQHFSGNNLADHSETEIESFFSELDFNHGRFAPAQEQFFGKIFNKVKSVVQKGVDLAKKGISVVGKFMPVNLILNRIKGLINPLLQKVLKFAIGKLPKNLQPHAQTLANKFLNLETSVANEAAGHDIFSAGELDAMQTELDNSIAQLLFSPDESESDNVILNYESSFDTVERNNNYESGASDAASLDVAREQFINELKELQPSQSPAPAIERFLPVAIQALQPVIKMALNIVGRQKVINFLADLLAKLIGKFVPENVAKPLAASIVDVGMTSIGFETMEMNKSDVAYEAIANTIAETVQEMGSLNEADLSDNETLTLHLLEAFETAAANNFPQQYIRQQSRKSEKPGTWVLKPRMGAKSLYKKFTHVFNITIDPQTSATVTSFRGLPLANFLRDKLSLDPGKPIQAKVHLYQAIEGTRINRISKHENLPGFSASQPFAWVQLHPLTKQAASLLLKEPGLGKDVHPKSIASRHRTVIGQRFYFLEINGARLRIPPVDHSTHKHHEGDKPGTPRPSQSGDIQAVINFIRSEIRFNYYFSEEDAKSVVEKLNKNDFLGVALSIRQSVRNVLHEMLLKNVSNKVKIIHEAMPELYLENMTDHANTSSQAVANNAGSIRLGGGKEILAKIIEQLVDKLSEVAYKSLADFFKARANEFRQAQAQPQDGVTINIIWNNIQGMSGIRTVINAIRGNLSLGNLGDLTLPNIPVPAIHIIADKKFD